MSNDGEELSRSHQLQIEKRKTILPGQGLALQFPVSSLGPLQSNPPLAGGGLVQVLNRVRFPPPHVTLQERQLSHSLHEPLTEIIYNKKTSNDKYLSKPSETNDSKRPFQCAKIVTWTACQATSPNFGCLTNTTPSAITRPWICAGSLSTLDASATGLRTGTPLCPLRPVAMH